MKKLLCILSCILLTGCVSTAVESDTLSEVYPYQASVEDNGDILILSKTEDALNEFLSYGIAGNFTTDDSENDDAGSGVANGERSLIIENVSAQPSDGTDYKGYNIFTRNNTGYQIRTVSLTVDWLDENGDIIESTYPQYSGSVGDGQAFTVDVLYTAIEPKSIRVSECSFYDMSDNFEQRFFEVPYVFDIE